MTTDSLGRSGLADGIGTPRPAKPRARHLPRIGHASRFGMSLRERYLVIGHLLVIALALGDDELVETLGEQFGWSAATMGMAETILSLGVLAAWGALTLAWVRCRAGDRP